MRANKKKAKRRRALSVLVMVGSFLLAAVTLVAFAAEPRRRTAEEAERRTLGWRQFLGRVNLKDFLEMVLDEAQLMGTSVRAAVQSYGRRVPLSVILVALVRIVALVVVVVVFGSVILGITVIRGALRVVRGLSRTKWTAAPSGAARGPTLSSRRPAVGIAAAARHQ